MLLTFVFHVYRKKKKLEKKKKHYNKPDFFAEKLMLKFALGLCQNHVLLMVNQINIEPKYIKIL